MAWQAWEDPDGNVEEEWISDFSKARNIAQEMVTGDVWCYIDSDTMLVHGDLWRADIDKYFENPEVGVMQLNYRYDEDDATGECNRDVKTKMIFRAGITEWVWPVHEQGRIISGQHHLVDASSSKYHIKHFKDREGHKEATSRNFWIIKNYMGQGGEMDARMWLSLATCQIGRGENEAALVAVRQVLKKDPCENDKWRALSAMGGIIQDMGYVDEALAAYGEMAAMHPERASPWAYIAQTLCNAGRWKEALGAVGRVHQYEGVDEGPTSNPLFLKYSPLYSAGRAYSALGEWEKAIASFEALLKIMPGMTVAEEHMEALRSQVRVADLYSNYRAVAENVPGVWKDAPSELDMLPEPARAKMPKRPKGRTPVMIWCGPPASGPWGPSDIASGMGGSEEAVVYLSRELAKQGCHVEVYGAPHKGEAGADAHGVVWVNHAGWEDRPGIFIQWRGTHMIAKAGKASARYVWLHDQQASMLPYDDALKLLVDGVFCLSEFHAEPLFEHGWADKIILTKNGLPPSVLAHQTDMERKGNTFAYYSSPDRGLDTVLAVWRDIRYRIPNATLDIFYGFTPYYLKAMTKHPHLRALKAKIEAQLLDLQCCGVTFKGMVGHDELHESMATTDFWLYPSMWPETSCITAMKCLALGCLPITARFEPSGTPETIGAFDMGPEPGLLDPYHDSAEIGRWVDQVVKVAKMDSLELNGIRQEAAEWSRERYSWERVATHWVSLFRAQGALPEKASSKGSRAKASSTAS